MHNVSLIVDDILDRSRYRRGLLSLHCRFGFLPALMASGYIGFSASALVADDPYSVRLVAELMQRLGVAECVQWRLRRRPLGVEDWRAIAGEDTGSMFEICARLGTRDDRLAKFGKLLGLLYHGCDDVADVRGTTALGGGSEKDIADGILTLPAALAIRNPETALLFERPDALEALTERLVDALDDAEDYPIGSLPSAERDGARVPPRPAAPPLRAAPPPRAPPRGGCGPSPGLGGLRRVGGRRGGGGRAWWAGGARGRRGVAGRGGAGGGGWGLGPFFPARGCCRRGGGGAAPPTTLLRWHRVGYVNPSGCKDGASAQRRRP